MLPANTDVVVFQCRNPVHRAHYELFTRRVARKPGNKWNLSHTHTTAGLSRPTTSGQAPFASCTLLAAPRRREGLCLMRKFVCLQQKRNRPPPPPPQDDDIPGIVRYHTYEVRLPLPG